LKTNAETALLRLFKERKKEIKKDTKKETTKTRHVFYQASSQFKIKYIMVPNSLLKTDKVNEKHSALKELQSHFQAKSKQK
jgi:hypothetical protein